MQIAHSSCNSAPGLKPGVPMQMSQELDDATSKESASRRRVTTRGGIGDALTRGVAFGVGTSANSSTDDTVSTSE